MTSPLQFQFHCRDCVLEPFLLKNNTAVSTKLCRWLVCTSCNKIDVLCWLFFDIHLTLQVGFTTFSYIPFVLYISVLCKTTTNHIATPSKYNHDTLATCSIDPTMPKVTFPVIRIFQDLCTKFTVPD